MRMDSLIKEFPNHLEKGLEIVENTTFSLPSRPFTNVLIVGLGGSGIGGKIASLLISDECPVPVNVCNDYTIPHYVGSGSLVITCSYSGNTEETLAAYQVARSKGGHVVCITSGGKLKAWSEEHGVDCLCVPEGYPPRAALGYSLVCLIGVFVKMNLYTNLLPAIHHAIQLIDTRSSHIHQEAKLLADHLAQGVPVIYSEARFEGVAVRFRQQVNENAKMLCWHHALPEMNHNELVGWGGGDERFRVVAFRSSFDHERTQTRMDLCKEIIAKKAAYHEVYAEGTSLLEQFIYLINLGDWTSWYLSEIKGVDAVEVNVIDFLKGQLAKS